MEGEENKEETGRKITAFTEEYLSFNNNETKLGKDLNDMLEKINSLKETSPSSEFLKGQLCLELYDIYKKNEKKTDLYPTQSQGHRPKRRCGRILESTNESFLESTKGEDFEIKVKNKEGKEITFASKSHSLAYLGDIAVRDFYEHNNKTAWDKSLEYYKEAIEAEPDDGKNTNWK